MHVYSQRSFDGNIFQFLSRLPRAISDRSKLIIRETGSAVKSGNVLKVLSIANPVGVAIRLTTSDQKKIDKMSVATPLTVGAIQDKDLRKKAAIGYGAAAAVASVIAVAAPAAAGGSGAASGSAAGGTAAGIGTAGSVAASGVGLAKAAGLLPGQKSSEASLPGTTASKGISEASMFTTENILLFVGLSALTAAGFMLFGGNKKK